MEMLNKNGKAGNTDEDGREMRSALLNTLHLRWRLLLGAILAVCVVAWFVSRKGGAKPDPENEQVAAVSVDSIIRLDSTAQRLAGITTLVVSRAATNELTANGTITFDANRVSVVSSRAEARVISVQADLGRRVAAGAILATLQSSEVGTTRGDLDRARVNVDIAKRNYEREERLYAQQITPQKELLDAEGAYRTAQADYNSALSSLRALGAAGGTGATYGLSSPVSGTVVQRDASPGQVVGPSTNLFTVADLREVWITVDVYEGDLSRIRQGAIARVTPNALPSRAFTGRVTYAGGVVDSATRTFKVRVEVDNAAMELRPGMFAQVRIETTAGSLTSDVVVPELAVQDLNGKQIIFVAHPTMVGAFVVRPVVAGARRGDGNIVIATGLRPGERIATKGAFQLKAELTKASFGED
jgi:cobalt-zinc-cadmium efflux system membrane fusion protein